MQDSDLLPVTSVVINRYHVDLTDETVRLETVQAEDLEDALGGVALATKLWIDIDFDDVPAVRGGLAADTPVLELREIAAHNSYTLSIHLNQGDGEAVIYACDTTEAYVRINVEE